MTIDARKLAAVCALLEGPRPVYYQHYLALGADPYILSQNHDAIAGAAAAAFVRGLVSQLEKHGVEFDFGQKPVLAEVLHQQPQELAVGVGLCAGCLAQGVVGASTNV